MASKTALDLVNEILVQVGDYSKIVSLANSPDNVAERTVNFMNLVLQDLVRKIDFPALSTSFTGTGDGVQHEFISAITTSSPHSAVACTVDTAVLEEVSRKHLNEMRDSQYASGRPAFFTTISGPSNELGVDIYPTPATGASIHVLSRLNPTPFTMVDTSTTELNADDLIVLGTIAYLDRFAGEERGFMRLYEASRDRLWTQMFSNQQYRIVTEDYH